MRVAGAAAGRIKRHVEVERQRVHVAEEGRIRSVQRLDVRQVDRADHTADHVDREALPHGLGTQRQRPVLEDRVVGRGRHLARRAGRVGVARRRVGLVPQLEPGDAGETGMGSLVRAAGAVVLDDLRNRLLPVGPAARRAARDRVVPRVRLVDLGQPGQAALLQLGDEVVVLRPAGPGGLIGIPVQRRTDDPALAGDRGDRVQLHRHVRWGHVGDRAVRIAELGQRRRAGSSCSRRACDPDCERDQRHDKRRRTGSAETRDGTKRAHGTPGVTPHKEDPLRRCGTAKVIGSAAPGVVPPASAAPSPIRRGSSYRAAASGRGRHDC